MDQCSFKEITSQFLKPLFTGSKLGVANAPKHSAKLVVYQRNQCTIAFRPEPDSSYRITLTRSQPFNDHDKEVVRSFIHALSDLKPLWTHASLPDLIRATMRRAIAKALSPGDDSQTTLQATIVEVVMQYESWAEQTYEGRRISAALGIEPSLLNSDGVALRDVYRADFGSVLAGGLETFLTVSADGFIHSYEPLPTKAPELAGLFAPMRFGRIAEWANNDRIGIGLNRNGEILIFKNNVLVFCKRRGSWHLFTHQAVIKRIALKNAIPSNVCAAIYESALDVSFARSGGCIAVVRRNQASRFRDAKVVAQDDLIAEGMGVKPNCLRKIIGRPFQELDRRLRAEILAMDGATVLGYKGEVLAAGAIVQVPAGSSGGGRLAATKALADYGLAIKISSDGAIQIFAKKQSKVEEIATVG